MKVLSRPLSSTCLAAALWLLSAGAVGQDVIPWAADFQQASQQAADSRRLVLLHFYNDDCPPCLRVEKQVFTQPQVAEAVTSNFVPLKIHAGKMPELAQRYQVNRWPTDVFVTPSGLEVFRSVSPQRPEAYVALVNQVALQSGVGAARQWAAVGQTGQQALQAGAGHFATQTQPYVEHASQRFGAAVSDLKTAADQARAAAEQRTQQAAATTQQWSQQATDAANAYNQQAQGAVNAYAQQAGSAYQQFQAQADGAAGRIQQDLTNATSTIDSRAQQLGEAARATSQQWQQTLTQTQSTLRSSFPLNATADASSAAMAPVAAAAPAVAATTTGPPASASAFALPADNPWVAAAGVGQSTAPSQPAAGGSTAPPLVAANSPSPAVAPPASNEPAPSEAQVREGHVPASQAPPIALDGYCPVTLLETMESKGPVTGAWTKANPEFGAIHRGRTYLFATKEAQEKFLANPDAFTPVLSGCDPVRYAQQGEFVEGKRAYGLVYGKRIFLFADEASLNRFDQTPAIFAETAHQAMLKSETTLYR